MQCHMSCNVTCHRTYIFRDTSRSRSHSGYSLVVIYSWWQPSDVEATIADLRSDMKFAFVSTCVHVMTIKRNCDRSDLFLGVATPDALLKLQFLIHRRNIFHQNLSQLFSRFCIHQFFICRHICSALGGPASKRSLIQFDGILI